jgi:hypothetical protein
VSQPKDPDRPRGAYFTDIEPSKTNFRSLYKWLRIPKVKQDFVFWFLGRDGLTHLNGGRGRDNRIFFSPTDYEVAPERQKHGGVTIALRETFA